MENMKERKLKILNAIIKDYILNAEPIGSRTIAKKYDLGVSAATIRNEMSDLEEMGLLIQPHTSAGRIPSEKAYRLYVYQLMTVQKLDQELEESIRDSYKQYVEQIEKSIQLTAKLLAQLTSYTSLVMAPEIKSLNYKLIQLLPIQDERIVNGWSNLKNKTPLIREVRNKFADIKPIQFEVGSSKVQKLNVVNDFEFGED